MKPEEAVNLAYDLAQIYAQKAHESMIVEDFTHAKRYRLLGQVIEELIVANRILLGHERCVK